VNILGPSLLAK